MPIDMDTEEDGPSRRGKSRKFSDQPRRPWWRPASTMGRVLLSLGALVVVFVFAVSAFALKSFLERDARFRIGGTSNIQAAGLAEVSRSEMLPVFGEDIGRNIFFVPLNERRKQLEQIPWVERASVMRLLPDQIRVSIVERKPVAFLRQGSQIGLVDTNGVLLTMPAAMMAQHHYSFPVVTGIDGRDPMASRKARMDVYQHLLSELDSNGQRLSDQISEIDLTDPEDARVLMPEQGGDILAHFGEDHFLERYQRYKAHIAEWRQQYPKLAEVDLRYDQQVVLQMTHGADSVPAALNIADAGTDTPMAPKPSPASTDSSRSNAKTSIAKSSPPSHAQTAKPVKPHTPAKPAPKSKIAKQKSAPKKKHTDTSHTATNSAKPKPAKTHPAPATGQAQ
jgi:cell division protein FtsQ